MSSSAEVEEDAAVETRCCDQLGSDGAWVLTLYYICSDLVEIFIADLGLVVLLDGLVDSSEQLLDVCLLIDIHFMLINDNFKICIIDNLITDIVLLFEIIIKEFLKKLRWTSNHFRR